MFDGAAFGKEMVGIVKGYVERALSPLLKRLDDLEIRSVGISEEAARLLVADAVAKAVTDLPAPPEHTAPWRPSDDELRALLQPMVDALPAPENGKSVTTEDVTPPIAEQVAKAVAALPLPAPVEPDDERLKAIIAPLIEALPLPKNGKSVTAEDVRPLLDELVAAALAEAVKSLPVPTDGVDGTSVTIEDVAPLIETALAKAAAAMPVPVNGKDGRDGINGKDGRDGLDAVTPILKDGLLLFTMSDGTIKEVGRVCGADGKDGDSGRDGIDGLGFDDMSADYDGERGIVLRFVRGERIKEFAFSMPVVIDRGVWLEGREGGYAKGDGVTWGGSFWISQKDDNDDKPDGGEGWRLSVKRGRDGKSVKVNLPPAPQPVKVG